MQTRKMSSCKQFKWKVILAKRRLTSWATKSFSWFYRMLHMSHIWFLYSYNHWTENQNYWKDDYAMPEKSCRFFDCILGSELVDQGHFGTTPNVWSNIKLGFLRKLFFVCWIFHSVWYPTTLRLVQLCSETELCSSLPSAHVEVLAVMVWWMSTWTMRGGRVKKRWWRVHMSPAVYWSPTKVVISHWPTTLLIPGHWDKNNWETKKIFSFEFIYKHLTYAENNFLLQMKIGKFLIKLKRAFLLSRGRKTEEKYIFN